MAHDIHQADKIRVVLSDLVPMVLIEVDGQIILRASSSAPLEVVDQRSKRESVLATSLPAKPNAP